ncbi:MAG: OmpA family protein [Endomicrobiales bacterium]|nr:OmpA family protein [Endomicrobiales bacterium]
MKINKKIISMICLLMLCFSAGSAKTIFSPNNDGINDVAIFKLQVSTPKEDISKWTFTIKDKSNKILRIFKGDGQPPARLEWDGRNLNKILVLDGVYHYVFSVITNAGNEETLEPQEIVIDHTKPKASADVDFDIFSPNADGVKDEATFTLTSQDLNGINSWLLNIADKDNNVVKSFSGVGDVKPAIIWDGKDDFGLDVNDGMYNFYLIAQDNAGNRDQTPTKQLQLVREAKVSSIKAKPKVFSPNNDGIKDIIDISIFAADVSAVEHWKLNVLNSQSKIVRTFSGKKAPPQRIIWDGLDEKGKTCTDGTYNLVLSETDSAGNTVSTLPVIIDLDSTPPICRVNADNKIFSPNGDKIFDITTLSYNVTDSHQVMWKLSIINDTGKQIKAIEGKSDNPKDIIKWNGKDDEENNVADGIFNYLIEAEDVAGNKTKTTPESIQVDRTAPIIHSKTSLMLFSPNRDGILDEVEFSLEIYDASPLKEWKLGIKNESGKTVRTFKGIEIEKKGIVWDGKGDDGVVLPDGTYLWYVFAEDMVANSITSETQKVVIGATKPVISVKSDLEIFSPNSDGFKDEVKFTFTASAFNKIKSWALRIEKNRVAMRTFNGLGNPPSSVTWLGENDDKRTLEDGRYSFIFVVDDEAGNKVETVAQNIIIDTTKPQLSISVSPGIFSPNGDDFKDNATFALVYQDESPAVSWKVGIYDVKDKLCRSYSGKDNPPLNVLWDGKDNEKQSLKDGVYNYIFMAEDIVGNKTTTLKERVKIDNTAPEVKLSASPTLFSPNEDGEKDTATFTLEYNDASDIMDWKLEAIGPNPARRVFKGSGRPSQNIIWYGKNDRGASLLDGKYTAKLYIRDEVGNMGESSPVEIEIDTSKPMVAVLTEEKPIQMLAPTYSFAETKRGMVISLAAEFLFDTAKASIKDEGKATLQKAASLIKRYPDRTVSIEGHTDNVPISNQEFPNNQILSEKRAESIMNFIIKDSGIPRERFVLKGYGDTKPIATNDTPEGRKKNRRVEIILVK